MALFKVFKGTEQDLALVPSTDKTEGYGYFIPNSLNYDLDNGETHRGGKLFFDIRNGDQFQRIQVDAQVARGFLVTIDGQEVYIPADQVATVNDLTDAVFTSEEDIHNGILVGSNNPDEGPHYMRAAHVATNSILLGDALNGIKEFTPQNNQILLGSTEQGVKNVGVEHNTFVVGDKTNGIKGADATAVRELISVYTKEEVDNRAVSVAYTATLTATGWEATGTDDEVEYYYKLDESRLKCGVDGNIPPMITYTSNLEDYVKIDRAIATAGTGIEFYTTEKPEDDIGIIIIDNA